MTDLEWLGGYDGQTTDELLALEGRYRTDSIILAFEEALDLKADRVGLENLNEEERVVLAVEALEREVNNGGYDQFFVNASNQHAPTIAHALERIGCTDLASLTRDALAALHIEGPVTAEAVEEAMDRESRARERRLAACDDRYEELAGDLADPLLRFVKAHRERIVL